MAEMNNYTNKATNWRKQLRINERRTKIVMALFIAIYLAIGLLVDIYIVMVFFQTPSYSRALYLLFTFNVIPYATLLMGGIGIISILVTYALYDKIMLFGTNYKEISPDRNDNTLEETQLYNVIEEMKVAAGLNYMPKVYIIEADYMNAFASGYSEKSAMVAITRGLLAKLDRAELQAVMAHELSHIRHHDIKLTLMASVLGNIMLLVIDLLFRGVIYTSMNKENSKDVNRLAIIIIILRFILPIITILLTLYLSRTREYLADAGAVELMRDNEPLARALLKINDDYNTHREHYNQEYSQTANEDSRRAAYIFDPQRAGLIHKKSFASFFSTHPDIVSRLKALGFTANKKGI